MNVHARSIAAARRSQSPDACSPVNSMKHPASMLSQSEIESLLAGQARDGAPRPAKGLLPAALRKLRSIQERFAREFAAGLAGMLRFPAVARPATIEPMEFGEFAAGFDESTLVGLIQPGGPEPDPWVVGISSEIVHPIIDRLLGGSGVSSHPGPTRRLTDIELKLLARVADVVAAALRNAWRDIHEVNPVMVVPRAQQASILAAETPVVLVRCDVTLGQAAGVLSLCVPCRWIEALVGIGSGGGITKVDCNRESNPGMVEVTAELASVRLTTEELRGLAVGDVIVTESGPKDALIVELNGVRRFTGSSGQVAGRKAVRISAALDAGEEAA